MPGRQTKFRRIAMFSQLKPKPAEFHVFDLERVAWEIPFEFRDIPLP